MPNSVRRRAFTRLGISAILMAVGLAALYFGRLSGRQATIERQRWSAAMSGSRIVVEVTGHGFQWQFRYPGADQTFGTADDLKTLGQLFLPVGKDVELLLKSDDYIYTFAIPELQLEGIAVPEMTHRISFHTSRETKLELLPDPMCGLLLFHDERMGSLVVGGEAELGSWVNEL